MIVNCINEKTPIIEINCDHLVEFNYTDVAKFNKIANLISVETGVPKKLIYTEPRFFFINNWHKIGNDWYFFKNCKDYDFYFINELLGEVISNYFNLDTVHYQVAKLSVLGQRPQYGVLSKNICDKRFPYKTAWDYGFKPNQDLSILDNLKKVCKNEEEYQLLLDDIKKLFIRDFYTSQLDRTGNNFLFKETPEGIRLAPLLDYENAFESIAPERYRNQIGEIDLRNKETREVIKKDFRFQGLLHILMNANMQVFLDNVEDTHKIIIPDGEKKYYLKSDENIKRLVRKNRIIR